MNSPPKPAKTIHQDRIVLGMLATAGAWLMFSTMNMCAKYLSTNHSVMEVAFYRNLIACIPFAVLILSGRRQILRINSKPGLVILRSIIGIGSIIATFAAFARMPMAETQVILFSASFFMPLLGLAILGESVSRFRWVVILIGFVGVAIMANPSGEMHVIGVSLALIAALLQAFMSIILRHLGGHESPETLTLYFFVIGTLITGLSMPFVAQTPSLNELPFFLGVGASAAMAQLLYSWALKHTPAAVVAVVNYSGFLWATFYGWLIWNEWPSTVVFAGAAIVIASNILIIWREARAYKQRAMSIAQTPEQG